MAEATAFLGRQRRYRESINIAALVKDAFWDDATAQKLGDALQVRQEEWLIGTLEGKFFHLYLGKVCSAPYYRPR
jgi:hypothetical protein